MSQLKSNIMQQADDENIEQSFQAFNNSENKRNNKPEMCSVACFNHSYLRHSLIYLGEC